MKNLIKIFSLTLVNINFQRFVALNENYLSALASLHNLCTTQVKKIKSDEVVDDFITITPASGSILPMESRTITIELHDKQQDTVSSAYVVIRDALASECMNQVSRLLVFVLTICRLFGCVSYFIMNCYQIVYKKTPQTALKYFTDDKS